MCSQVQQKNEKKRNDDVSLAEKKSCIDKLLSNKKLFPFPTGVNRLLFVLWIGVALYVEIKLWKVDNPYYESYIANYGWGIVVLLVLAIVYRVLLWIYRGFKIRWFMIGCIFFYILACCLVSWLFCDIDSKKTYSWYAGIWHGIFIIPNFIRSLFTDALYKAEHYTAAYNVFYWISSIMSVLITIFGGGSRKWYLLN